MSHKQVVSIVSLLVCLVVVVGGYPAHLALADRGSDPPRTPARTGAWVDTVHVREIASTEDAIAELEAGTLQVYAYTLSDRALEARVLTNPDLAAVYSYGSYNELTLNPAGPVCNDGRLNPFDVPAVREALNRLVDRQHVIQAFMGGLGVPKFFPISTSFPDYVRYRDTAQALETAYAHDLGAAEAVISAEMVNLGATLVNDKWHYDGEPVTLIFLIRVEDERRQVGDYVSDQLERIGFTVDRRYVTSAEASPLWVSGDPANCLWHLYTGGWVTTAISRDQGGNFVFFYTPDSSYGFSPLWQAYTPSPAFAEAAGRLNNGDYATMAERDQLFTDALALALEDSVRVWLVDRHSFTPFRTEVTAAFNRAGGFAGSRLWPNTLRFVGQEGGTVEIAMPSILTEPWNPVGGSNWIYDSAIQRATSDYALVDDPNDGLWWPQRLDHADVYVEAGLPVSRTHDWLTLTVSPTIEVPADAWVDWDATNQVWVTAADKFTQTQTARTKVVATFPPTLTTDVLWHDNSPFSVADLLMSMIVRFDMASPASPIYDESTVAGHDSFMEHFKGFRFVSLDPLIVEWYDDSVALDAELVVNNARLWPNYGYGEAAWHTMAVATMAEAAGELAFTPDKADALGVPYMSFLDEPSRTILDGYLGQAQMSNLIPYYNTLSGYITAAEAAARWASLQAWRAAHAHYWVGAGPFYLDTFSIDDGSATLQRFPAFPDRSGKWDRFASDGAPTSLNINYDTGAPGSAFTMSGFNFPINTFVEVTVNFRRLGTVFTGDTGSFSFALLTVPETEEGLYTVRVGAGRSLVAAFELDGAEPERPPEGEPITFDVPDDIAYQARVWLPVIGRRLSTTE